DAVNLEVDHDRRIALQSNHSATHLLHAALRRHLGDHVTQKGSLVAPDRLRFDISHPKAVAADELNAVEAEVNARIRDNAPLTTRIMTPEDAITAGAMALFGEKYGDEVRVVSMGGDATDGDEAPYSVELCGGVHVRRTGDIGLFRVVAEQATAAGVRRIEALTGEAARNYVAEQEDLLKSAATVLKSTPADVPDRIAALLDDRKRLEREISDLHRRIATGDGGDTDATVREVGSVPFVARQLDGVAPKELRGLVDALKKQTGSGVFALVTVADGKVALTVGVSDDLTDRFSAVDLVRAGASAVGGKGGGGRPDMAQAGGPDTANAANALVAIERAVADAANA
ncbi:MAG: alanine--tRNA ligase, partial [Alphaproteobacteria bacterium]|nr:alanine--tRNA ligase [Alphaproteobacteria bacterium]